MGGGEAQQARQRTAVRLVLDRAEFDELSERGPEGVVVGFGSRGGVASGQKVVGVVLVGAGGAGGNLLRVR